MMPHTVVHQHRRKRAYQLLEQYPHPDKRFQYLDSLVDVVTILFPLTMIPQIIEIWVDKSVQGVSLLTWCLFLFFQIILFLYAIAHKDKRLMVMWALWILGEVVIILGVLLFR